MDQICLSAVFLETPLFSIKAETVSRGIHSESHFFFSTFLAPYQLSGLLTAIPTSLNRYRLWSALSLTCAMLVIGLSSEKCLAFPHF